MVLRQITRLSICCLAVYQDANAWSSNHASKANAKLSGKSSTDDGTHSMVTINNQELTRRGALIFGALITTGMVVTTSTQPVFAYTPDPDKLRESLYLMSRVQEATVLQERFVTKGTMQEDLKNKMKLTLFLVEKNYRLLDQINYASSFVDPKDELVAASEAGYEAVDALQGAIDYVKNDLGVGPLSDSQKTFLTSSLKLCRENLFIFLKYMPQDKLEGARKRVEEENVLNREEFDGDADAGVYNPIVLPWKLKK
jgi:hypothetical protein